MLHADARRPIAPHGVANQAAAQPIRDCTIVSIDICHQIVRNELLKISRRGGTRVHRTIVHSLGIGQNNDHLVRALGKSAFYRLRNVDFMGPLLRPDGISVQCVDNGIATMLVFLVAGWQKYEHLAVNGVALQIPFESLAVDLDPLDHYRLRSGNDRGHFSLDLCLKPRQKSHRYRERMDAKRIAHLSSLSFRKKCKHH